MPFRPLTTLALLAGAALAAGCTTVAPQYLNVGQAPSAAPFSNAVKVGHTLYLSGQIGLPPGGRAVVPGGVPAETRQVMENIKASAAAHGYAMDDMVKCTVMLTDIQQLGAFTEVYRSYFKPDRLPARSALGVAGLALNATVEVECMGAK